MDKKENHFLEATYEKAKPVFSSLSYKQKIRETDVLYKKVLAFVKTKRIH